jgi:hypothetical protein
MTIVEEERLAEAGYAFEAKPGDDCFYCGEPLEIPYVMWSGCGNGQKLRDRFTGQIALHPSCARLLGASIVHDADRALKLKRGLG